MPVYRKLSDIPTPAEYTALVKAFFRAERKRELISVPARFERQILNSLLWAERLKRKTQKNKGSIESNTKKGIAPMDF